MKEHEAMAKEMTRFGPESVDQMGAEMALDLDQDETTEFFFLAMKPTNPVDIRWSSVTTTLVPSHMYGGWVVWY